MASTLTNAGRELVVELLATPTNSRLTTVAVGDGNTAPLLSDTQLQNELFRDNTGSSNVSIENNSNTGEVVAKITVSGGTEVAGGAAITEFGVFDDSGVLVFRETFDPVTVLSGDRKTLEVTLEVTS